MNFSRSILRFGVVLAASLGASISHAQPDSLINAAQFEQISSGCGGCLEVHRDTVTVAISKDNVFFGVRAEDANGHRSVVVVP